jgi:hypothetical protein
MKNSTLRNTAVAAAAYLALTVYLYQPYIRDFTAIQLLLIFNSVAAATGAFLLSRRWIAEPAPAIIAGALYGFSPMAIGFTAYHPLASLPLALLPWLLLPAVIARRPRSPARSLASTAITTALYLLPLALIVLFFWLLAQPWIRPFFPLPKSARLNPASLAALLAPLTLKPHQFAFAFYHIPVAIAIVGLIANITAHRIVIMLAAATCLILAFAAPILEVPPVVWSLVPALYCSIAIGLGTQALILAGPADAKWPLAAFMAATTLTALTILLGLRLGPQWFYAAKLHTLAMAMLAAIFFIARAKLRWHIFRSILLTAAMALDIILGARYLIDAAL